MHTIALAFTPRDTFHTRAAIMSVDPHFSVLDQVRNRVPNVKIVLTFRAPRLPDALAAIDDDLTDPDLSSSDHIATLVTLATGPDAPLEFDPDRDIHLTGHEPGIIRQAIAAIPRPTWIAGAALTGVVLTQGLAAFWTVAFGLLAIAMVAPVLWSLDRTITHDL